MRSSRLLAGLAVVALLAACDGGGSAAGNPGGTPASSRPGATGASTDPAALFRQVADCLRTHGYPDFPDPVRGDDGTWGFPSTAERITVPDACADVFSRSKALYPDRPKGGGLSEADMAKARQFAKCMRDNGLPDWPDPNADGSYSVPGRLARAEDEPLWQPTADGLCKQYAPAGGAIIAVAH